jgi:ribosome-associated toxin RatA of RatAB toxin-antitoxin module
VTQINRSALLAYPVEQIYSLVNDIAMYPQYLDGCVGAKIISQDESTMVARLDLSKKGIRQSFTTRNVMVDGSHIKMQLVDGPFKRFSGEWVFTPLSDKACKVSLTLEFELTSMAMKMAAGKLFSKVSANLVDALSKRAKEIYG